ncbi:MAG TPA: hypothetical protein VF783_14330, partial [Terriglobales bacterium]
MPDSKAAVCRPHLRASCHLFICVATLRHPSPRSSVMQVPYANTTNFSVSYDSTFTGGSNPNGLAL